MIIKYMLFMASENIFRLFHIYAIAPVALVDDIQPFQYLDHSAT